MSHVVNDDIGVLGADLSYSYIAQCVATYNLVLALGCACMHAGCLAALFGTQHTSTATLGWFAMYSVLHWLKVVHWSVEANMVFANPWAEEDEYRVVGWWRSFTQIESNTAGMYGCAWVASCAPGVYFLMQCVPLHVGECHFVPDCPYMACLMLQWIAIFEGAKMCCVGLALLVCCCGCVFVSLGGYRHEAEENAEDLVVVRPTLTAVADLPTWMQQTTTCAICLECTCTPPSPWVQLRCSHWFHADCLRPWLATRTTCPLCRQQEHRQCGLCSTAVHG